MILPFDLLKRRGTLVFQTAIYMALLSWWIAATPDACAQHLWYNDPGAGDILLIDVNVTNTSVTTYYETLGWNQGADGGGYTGIQTHPNGSAYIFSLWDPADPQATTTRAIYQKPGSTVQRAGGEGTGTRYLDFSTKWSVGKPVTMCVRNWPVGTHTYFGMWAHDSATGVWTHHVTLDYPISVNFSYGATSFLENWTGQSPNDFRRAEFFNGWKQRNGKWYSFTRADADHNGQFGKTSNNHFVLQTGVATTGFTSPVSVNISAKSPTLPPLSISGTQMQWNKSTHGLTVNWTIDVKGAPQYAYNVTLTDPKTKKVLATSTAIVPQSRSVALDLSKTTLPAQVQMTLTVLDIINRTSSTSRLYKF